jgi:hypothetical protein
MQDDPRTITINTFRVEGEKEDFSVVRERLQRSLDGFQVTERVQIECLRPLPGDRINVVFRTEAEARTAREHKQWVTTAMPTARVKGETWSVPSIGGVEWSGVELHSIESMEW